MERGYIVDRRLSLESKLRFDLITGISSKKFSIQLNFYKETREWDCVMVWAIDSLICKSPPVKLIYHSDFKYNTILLCLCYGHSGKGYVRVVLRRKTVESEYVE